MPTFVNEDGEILDNEGAAKIIHLNVHKLLRVEPDRLQVEVQNIDLKDPDIEGVCYTFLVDGKELSPEQDQIVRRYLHHVGIIADPVVATA